MNRLITHWTPALLLTLAGSAHSHGAGSFPATIEMSSLNGTNGFVMYGVGAGDYSGMSVSSAGDINGDNTVDSSDLGILIGEFGTTGPSADINGDGVVGSSDLGILIGAFGTACL